MTGQLFSTRNATQETQFTAAEDCKHHKEVAEIEEQHKQVTVLVELGHCR